MNYQKYRSELEENGYAIVPSLYTKDEICQIIACLENANPNGSSYVKTINLYAIRQLFKSVPDLPHLIFNRKLIGLISDLSKSDYFLTKAIYFDKPPESNWFVAYHQDLSITVDKKIALKNYSNWTFKKGQYGVQPPIHILKDTLTVRIHLDHTDKNNGALKVIPKSHLNGIIQVASKDYSTANEQLCKVDRGGAMLMKPLTMHASSRTLNQKQRRVIHLELNKHQLTKPLKWLEFYEIGPSIISGPNN